MVYKRKYETMLAASGEVMRVAGGANKEQVGQLQIWIQSDYVKVLACLQRLRSWLDHVSMWHWRQPVASPQLSCALQVLQPIPHATPFAHSAPCPMSHAANLALLSPQLRHAL